jgi:hypothetical protein
LQEGDENTDPDPVKGLAYYSVGFPLRDAYTAWGANWLTMERMTLPSFSDRTDQMLTGDIRWHRKWIFGTLTVRRPVRHRPRHRPLRFADPDYGNLSVYGLANGDAATYEKFGNAAPATDTHYTAQNGAISDTAGQNPFPTIETALLEHPSNGGPIVCFIDPALATTVKALASFVPAPLIYGLATPGPGSTARQFAGTLPFPLPPAAQVIGEIGNIIIATWRSVPTNLIISRAGQSAGPPLLFRQRPETGCRGSADWIQSGRVRGQVPLREFPLVPRRRVRQLQPDLGARPPSRVSSTTYAMPSAYYPLVRTGVVIHTRPSLTHPSWPHPNKSPRSGPTPPPVCPAPPRLWPGRWASSRRPLSPGKPPSIRHCGRPGRWKHWRTSSTGRPRRRWDTPTTIRCPTRPRTMTTRPQSPAQSGFGTPLASVGASNPRVACPPNHLRPLAL